MTKIKLKKDEKLILETKGTYEKYQNVFLILTSKRVIFRKEKGLFKTIGYIPMENIKTYKDDVQISRSKSSITIHTIKDDVTFTCDSVINARKVISEIITIITGVSPFERALNKLAKATKVVTKAYNFYEGNIGPLFEIDGNK